MVEKNVEHQMEREPVIDLISTDELEKRAPFLLSAACVSNVRNRWIGPANILLRSPVPQALRETWVIEGTQLEEEHLQAHCGVYFKCK